MSYTIKKVIIGLLVVLLAVYTAQGLVNLLAGYIPELVGLASFLMVVSFFVKRGGGGRRF